jgi:hypothetical protein
MIIPSQRCGRVASGWVINAVPKDGTLEMKV